MKKEKQRKTEKQKQAGKKIKITPKTLFLWALILIALVVLVYQGYLTVRYRLHNGHLAVLSEHLPPQDGGAFTPLDISANDVPGMVLAAENETLRLYVDEVTTNIALYDKRNGSIVYSAHPDMKDDPLASDLNKSFLQSHIILDYYTSARLPGRWNSYDHSVQLGQFRFESLEDGLRIVYTIGDTSSPTGIVPVYITQERLEMFLAPLEGTRAYTRNLMRYIESEDAPGFMELIEAARTGRMTITEMNEVFASVGYTSEDYMMDMEASGMEVSLPLHFVVPLEFLLDGDSLLVNLNTAGIREYASGAISAVQLMRGFGAGSTEEDGYLVVPNGSGSLIYFNNGKTYADEYMQYIYGEDPMQSEYVILGNTEITRMPFFGIEAYDGRTILGRVESGDTQCYLTAGISEKYNSYNYVYPGFTLRGSLSLAMFGMTGNESTLPVVERDLPQMNLTVRYSLLTDSGYSAMAKRARELLTHDGTLGKELLSQSDIPFYMDLIGSTMGQKFFLGLRYMAQIPLTTYAQAEEIVSDLYARDISRQIINYQGWFNRGYYHDVADKIRPVRQLGSTSALEALARNVETGGGKLYSDVNMITATWSSRRYRYELESTRYYAGGMVGGFGMINPITLYKTNSLGYLEVMYNAISPRFMTRYMDSYIKAQSRYDLTGTSLRDMGDFLASDRRRTGMIHRQQAKEVIEANMENLQNQGKPIMISGGNLYAVRYSDDIINMPLSHNAFYIVDDEIPFYQMILHGRIDYAGTPINISSAFDKDQLIIRLLEYGAAPHFAFTYESAGEMKYTGLNWMYSTHYENWKDMAGEIYHTLNDALGLVSGAEMTTHEILSDGLRVVTYSNGVRIIINRTESDLIFEGERVAAAGYIVKHDN
ncbi:MAG: DUF5696 domain-containing protein [Oscillospiraceae bacterium]|nr:DUF5696 domain-containing protein [Oscillospiraceae bacterium]